MPKPVVTAILPSLNVKNYIEECLDSVTGQTLQEIEILCIDAGSTDGTLEILREYAQKDSRIKVIHSDVKSYGRQVNMGFDCAQGGYIAVVETDDAVKSSMFEKLYTLAEENNLDFVKADFRGFRTLSNGMRIYDEGRTFEDDSFYGKIITVRDCPKLYLRDVNIWKGLYNREFLLKNKIRLNETPKAAFQDIGFAHSFLFYAKRGMYVKDMLYDYRRDSGGSSSNLPYGLQYAYQEYSRLVETPPAGTGGDLKLYMQWLYIRMAHVFVGEYEKWLSYGGKMPSGIQEAAIWLKKVLCEAVEQKNITDRDVPEPLWGKLLSLIYDEKEFCFRWERETKLRQEAQRHLLEQIGTKEAAVFGCGNYGKKTLLLCDKLGVRVAAFCDNNPNLWGKEFYGYKICRPSDLKTIYKDLKVLIAVKGHETAIREQLAELGIRERDILPAVV